MKKLWLYCVLCICLGGTVTWLRRETPFAFAATEALTVAGGGVFALSALARFFASEYADGAVYAFRLRAFAFSGETVSFRAFKEVRKEKREESGTEGVWLGGILFALGMLFLPFF